MYTGVMRQGEQRNTNLADKKAFCQSVQAPTRSAGHKCHYCQHLLKTAAKRSRILEFLKPLFVFVEEDWTQIFTAGFESGVLDLPESKFRVF